MFDLNSPIDENIIPREEQLRRVREQRDARVADREGLKLSFRHAQIANDIVLQESLKSQGDGMSRTIEALEKQLAELESANATQTKRGKNRVKK